MTERREDGDEAARKILLEFDLQRLIAVSTSGKSCLGGGGSEGDGRADVFLGFQDRLASDNLGSRTMRSR